VEPKKLRILIYSALMAAMVCAATAVIRIPSPTGGYVNAGDGVVLLCGWLLGPWYGGAAAGVGSLLTDLLMGYAHYAPGTLVIKGLDAVAAGLIFRSMGRSFRGQLLGGVAGEVIMTAGYFGYSALLLQRGLGAAASVPGNLVQGAVGLVTAVLVLQALRRTSLEQKLIA
jgi:uncharacterized membrane protein